ncbi:zinc ribbon domain-containing protein [Okeania sp. SIO2B3]|uniref:zinc ribbon domain-containing protein n=1 Tax=Okeania sp. SIO2B3 TaxID=2607784 RepID=UPI0025EE5D17|nr:zinc ribbon domain-containing protein [Okeania sp. SIO2B3]
MRRQQATGNSSSGGINCLSYKTFSYLAFPVICKYTSAHCYTSHTCPNCRSLVRKELSDRSHSCPECKYEADRDVASAQEICNRGYEQLTTQGLWEQEIGCQVGLSGTFCLDKWHRAAMSNSDVGSPRCTS